MDNNELARILYELSLDMDADDYEDYHEENIEAITRELVKIENCNPLRYVLESIAESY